MFKFLHAADLHLDSPLHGLERYEGAPVDEIRGASRRALDNLVQLAIEEEVKFVLFAGDQYDRDQDDYRTLLFFTRQMQRLREAGIAVYMITGNHDAASKMTKSLRLPDNVRLLSSKEPETIRLDDIGVAIHGRGFAKQAESDNLAAGYPQGQRGWFNVGILHTSLDGREGHDSYAPCSLDDLRLKEYDYWALGHIHKQEEVAQEPWVVFPGNVQGRSIRETGPKGCYLVAVDERRRAVPKFMPRDVFRWAECNVSAIGATSADQIVDQVTQKLAEIVAEHPDHALGVRVRVQGSTEAHATLQSNSDKWTHEIRAVGSGVNGDRLWLEKIQFRTTPCAEALDRNSDSPLSELLTLLDEARSDETLLAELGNELDDLRRRLPSDPTNEEPLLPDHLDWLRQVLDDVKPLLVERLTKQEAQP